MGDFYFSALLKWQTRVIPNSETVLSMHAVFGRHRRCRQHVHNRSTCVDTQFRRAASACGIMRTMSDIKTPPQNTEAERAVLGSILLDTTGRSDGRVMDECRSRGVTPETFFDPSQVCHFLFRECPFDPIVMRLSSSLPHNFRLHHQKTDIDDFSLVSSPFVYAWGVTSTPNALRIVPMSSPSASSIM